MHAFSDFVGLYLLDANTMMLEVRLVTGDSAVGSVCPIMTPPMTISRMSFMSTLFWVRILLTGVPIFTSRFFGFETSPFKVVTREIRGSPSKTAFAMALMVATFCTMVPISYDRLFGGVSYLKRAFWSTLASPC